MPDFSPPPGHVLSGVVRSPKVEANQDGRSVALSMGSQGQAHVAAIHGQWYTAAKRGNLFVASTAAAGVTIPVEDTSALASTAGMVNPANSGVVCELVGLAIVNTTVEVAVKPNIIAFQTNLSGSGGPPTSVTALTAYNLATTTTGGNLVIPHSAATFTNTVEMAPRFNILGTVQTAVGFTPGYFAFNGEIVFGPNNAFAIVNAVTAIAGHQITYIWAEWPI